MLEDLEDLEELFSHLCALNVKMTGETQLSSVKTLDLIT